MRPLGQCKHNHKLHGYGCLACVCTNRKETRKLLRGLKGKRLKYLKWELNYTDTGRAREKNLIRKQLEEWKDE